VAEHADGRAHADDMAPAAGSATSRLDLSSIHAPAPPSPITPGNAISLLTYNVFIGTASPLPSGQLPGLPTWLVGAVSTPTLVDSRRLRTQVQGILKLRPDVVALQEVYSVGLLEAYREGLPDYDIVTVAAGAEPGTGRGYRGPLLLLGIHALGTLAWLALLSCTPAAAYGLLARALVAAACAAAVTLALATQTAVAYVFLTGGIVGAVATAYRREAFEIDESAQRSGCYAKLFDRQRGDVLNLLRPRGYLATALRRKRPRPAAGAGEAPMWIINLHTNAMGDVRHRVAQAEELVRASAELGGAVLCGDFNSDGDSQSALDIWLILKTHSDACEVLPTSPRFPGSPKQTWRRQNPRSEGMLLAPDMRCDYVFLPRQRPRSAALRAAKTQVVLDEPFTPSKTGDALQSLSDHYGLLVHVRAS